MEMIAHIATIVAATAATTPAIFAIRAVRFLAGSSDIGRTLTQSGTPPAVADATGS